MFNTFSCIVFLAIMCLHLGLGRYHLNRICLATYDTMLGVLRDLSTILILCVYKFLFTFYLEVDFQRQIIPKIYIICY